MLLLQLPLTLLFRLGAMLVRCCGPSPRCWRCRCLEAGLVVDLPSDFDYVLHLAVARAAEADFDGDIRSNAESVGLLDEIINLTSVTQQDEAYEVTRNGLQALISELTATKAVGEKVTKGLVDNMIAELDQKVSRQLDQILHHEAFQKMESNWRGLKFLPISLAGPWRRTGMELRPRPPSSLPLSSNTQGHQYGARRGRE